MTLESSALTRIEGQLSALTDAVTRLVVIEERQGAQAKRLDKIEGRQDTQDTAIAKNKDELAKWINRGIGLWGAVMAVWALLNSPAGRALSGG